MTHQKPRMEPELEALLKPRKIDRFAPAEVHARAIARGRAIVAAGGRIPPGLATEPLAQLPAPAPVWRGYALNRIALVASLSVVVAATGTVLALRAPAVPASKAALAPQAVPALTLPPAAAALVEAAPEPATEAPPIAPVPSAAPKAATPARAANDSTSFSAEVDLLARAQAAYTSHDYSRALSLVAEHARRFPNGHLSEEREALRVRSLLGSGRPDEAHRVSAGFAQRFPRSVLLPRVEGTAPQK